VQGDRPRVSPTGGSSRGTISGAEKVSDYVAGLLALGVRNPLQTTRVFANKIPDYRAFPKPTPGLEPGTPSLRVKCSTS
jgi:hypothetical protein